MRVSECRDGRHRYGPITEIGAGLRRKPCKVCNAVTIDLTKDQLVLSNRPNLFVGEEDRVSIFGGGYEQDLRPLPSR